MAKGSPKRDIGPVDSPAASPRTKNKPQSEGAESITSNEKQDTVLDTSAEKSSKPKSVIAKKPAKDKDMEVIKQSVVLLGGLAIAMICMQTDAIPMIQLAMKKLKEQSIDLFMNVDDGGWKGDTNFYKSSNSANVGCDFPIITVESFEKSSMVLTNRPFVVRGAINSWPAMVTWSKSNFTDVYGSYDVKIGSESSIVFDGGSSGSQSTLRKVIESLKRPPLIDEKGEDSVVTDASDSFTFDVSILKSIPALENDFSVPPMFSSWDNAKANTDKSAWHMLSMGASRTGRSISLSVSSYLTTRVIITIIT